MAETKGAPSPKKRQLKKSQTVRQRVESSDSDVPKTGRVRVVIGLITLPFKMVFKLVKFVLKPFAFLLAPFRTAPAKKVGGILASVLLLRFFRDAWGELRQVQWPTARETVRLTIAVFIFSLVFGTIIALTDYGLGKVFRKVFID